MQHIAIRTLLDCTQLGHDVLLNDIDSHVIEQVETIEYKSDLIIVELETVGAVG